MEAEIELQSPEATGEVDHSKNWDPYVFDVNLCVSWTELDATELDDSPMLWDGFLPSNEIAMLAGVGGFGKSTIIRQLSIAIAQGESHFLTRPIHGPNRRVLYIACEDSERKTRKLLRTYSDRPVDGLKFLFAASFTVDQVLEQIDVEKKNGNLDLIVIDSLGNIFEGDQNSNSDAQDFLNKFTMASQESTVLFLHHIRKSDHRSTPDQAHIQGAGAFAQRSRAVLMLTGSKFGTERYLHMEKENDVSDTFKYDAMILQFDRETKRYSSIGETKSVSEIGRPETPNEWESLFHEGETELQTSVLVPRIMSKYNIQERAAKERLTNGGLQKTKRGVYARPGVNQSQSADSALVQ